MWWVTPGRRNDHAAMPFWKADSTQVAPSERAEGVNWHGSEPHSKTHTHQEEKVMSGTD